MGKCPSRLKNVLHATKDISIQQEQWVNLLRECIMIRDNVLLCLFLYCSVADVQSIILY